MASDTPDKSTDVEPDSAASDPIESSNGGSSSAPDAVSEAIDSDEALEAARAEAAENWAKYLRAAAEIDNLRKRNSREVENARRYGVERLATGLLPVRDSLEAGLQAAESADAGAAELAALVEGERATLRLLEQALEAVGIREIDPAGEPFDPLRHEAMSMMPSADVEPDSVLTVVQKGYELNDRIIRPARVIVAQAPPESAG